jgi:aryl-alcohol dehydrogenase-like predicted oxidoreductase
MEYINLGKTGLKVSKICLGCMSYGDPSKGPHSWVLKEDQSFPFIKKALEQGINFFDTANMYSIGASEEILGKAIQKYSKREDLVIATKVFFPLQDKPNSKGLSRKAILQEIDNSLRRLNMDYVDLYQIHRFDDSTPIEETLEALHDVVKSGKARYIGASSMYAWQFTKMLYTSKINGWTQFVSMQPHYNLLYREEEREMLPLCQNEGIGVIPWSPLARGRLARPWSSEPTERIKTDKYGKGLYANTEQNDQQIVNTLENLAKKRNLPQSQLALAWVLSKPYITSPIVGATKDHHLDDAIAALNVKLSADEIKELEAPYLPHPVAGLV